MSLNLGITRVYRYRSQSKKIAWLPSFKNNKGNYRIGYYGHRFFSWLIWDFPFWKVRKSSKPVIDGTEKMNDTKMKDIGEQKKDSNQSEDFSEVIVDCAKKGIEIEINNFPGYEDKKE